MGPITGSLLGLLMGVRHALEPDHLAAVSTLLTDARTTRRSALLGAWWGMGHTVALVSVGAVVTALQATLPQLWSTRAELVVAAMLLLLGGMNVYRALQRPTASDAASHRHAGVTHTHGPATTHVHVRDFAVGLRPLSVGLVHGLAGSGALTALAMSHTQGMAPRLLYMVLFGLGSMAGMTVLAGVLGGPLTALMQKPRVRPVLMGMTGVLSMGLGVAWGWPLLGV